LALLDVNRVGEAETQLLEATRLKPGDAAIQYHLATVLIRQHRLNDAIASYREALRLQPQYPEALDGLAWILATDPSPGRHGGPEAVELAEKACQQTQYQEARFVVTLAAAYAEMGRFSEAIASAQKARDRAAAAGESDVAARADELLKLFSAGRTVRQTLNSGSGESR
jgi:cytochrome c-type biogenesis protein CcmH/NrfG